MPISEQSLYLRKVSAILIVLLLGMSVSSAQSVFAADISIVSYRFSVAKPIPHILVKGPIWKGDVEQLERTMARALGCSGDNCDWDIYGSRAVVSLESPGGSLLEGIEFATYFQENLIATIVEDGDSCLSACAIAFLGGSGFWPTGGVGAYSDRVLEPGAVLGFHSPFFPSSKVKEIVASSQMSQALKLTRMGIAKFVGVLNKYHVNPLVIDSIIEMGEDEFYYVDTVERLLYLRTSLPEFSPDLLQLSYEKKLRNVCARLVSSFYNSTIGNGYRALADGLETPVAYDVEENPIFGYQIDDRPYVLSNCATSENPSTNRLSTVSLYKLEEDAVAPFITFHNASDGGWSGTFSNAPDNWFALGTMNQFFLAPESKISELNAQIKTSVARDRYVAGNARFASRKNSVDAISVFEGATSRVWYLGEATIVERVGTRQLFDDMIAEAGEPDIDLALSRDYPNAFVRSGTYIGTGNTFYWAGFQKGGTSAIFRIEYGHEARAISKQEKLVTTSIACSTDFQGVRLPCYK